jgi:hypothetical protein
MVEGFYIVPLELIVRIPVKADQEQPMVYINMSL